VFRSRRKHAPAARLFGQCCVVRRRIKPEHG
jgi:hypothetical protein